MGLSNTTDHAESEQWRKTNWRVGGADWEREVLTATSSSVSTIEVSSACLILLKIGRLTW